MKTNRIIFVLLYKGNTKDTKTNRHCKMNTSYQSIGLFIDGGYYAKICESLENNYSLSLDFRQLLNMIKA